jgi:hypothetical protein
LAYEFTQGQITSHGVYQSLRQKLVNAQADMNKTPPDEARAAQKISDFIAQVEKEQGKGTITPEAAAILQETGNCVLGTLNP